MKQVSVTDLKNRLSQYLRLVKQGEVIEILEHAVPIARLEGLQPAQNGDALLDQLLRDGIISHPARKPGRDSLKMPPVPCAGDIVDVLIDERGDR